MCVCVWSWESSSFHAAVFFAALQRWDVAGRVERKFLENCNNFYFKNFPQKVFQVKSKARNRPSNRKSCIGNIWHTTAALSIGVNRTTCTRPTSPSSTTPSQTLSSSFSRRSSSIFTGLMQLWQDQASHSVLLPSTVKVGSFVKFKYRILHDKY